MINSSSDNVTKLNSINRRMFIIGAAKIIIFTGIITRYNNNRRYISIADPYSTSNTETDSRGLYCGGTNGSSNQILYKNGVNVLSGTSLQSGFSNINIFICAVNSLLPTFAAAGFSSSVALDFP